MQAIAATYTLSEKLQCPARIIWIPNKQRLDARFGELFYPIEGLPVTTIDPRKSFINKLYGVYYESGRNKWIRRVDDLLIRKLEYDIVFENKHTRGKISKENIESIKKSEKVLFVTGHDFVKKEHRHDDIFNLKSHVKEEVKKGQSKLGKGTVGMHIRATDHGRAKKRSPAEEFYKVVKREIKENSGVDFYLATDSERVKSNFNNKFGNRIITNEVPLTRGSVPGIKGALVDLHCLAETERIYGSQVSSFCRTAAEIGNTDLIRVAPGLASAFLPLS